MKNLIILKWDIKLGPQPLLQYPPDKNFPDKEVFLRIWAKFEMSEGSNFVEINEKNSKFLSVIKKENNEIYFLILQLEKEEEFSKFHDILLKLSSPLFAVIDTPKLTRLISEMYNTIYEYSKLNEEQLFFNVFSDKDKMFILDVLRKGSIDKISLGKILKEKYGTSESNLDILINPFFHLGLIKEENMPGIANCIFLINDVYMCRLPPKNILITVKDSESPADKMFISEISDYYMNYSLEDDENINELSRFMSDVNIYNAIQQLNEKIITKNKFLNLISQDLHIFQTMKQYKLIVEIEENIYPLAEIHFFKFTPIYIIKDLKDRYIKNEISTDQLIKHLNLLKNNQ